MSALGQPNSDPLIYDFTTVADRAPSIDWTEGYPEELQLPINQAVDFSLQASDSDFAISQIRTTLMRGRSKLDDNLLLLNEEGVFASVDRTWRFEPVKMGLRPGDELTLQAFASDNRRDLTEAKWEPNTSSTRIIKIVIVKESEQPTEFTKNPEDMQKLPDQPIDGSDIPQEANDQANASEGTTDAESKQDEESSSDPMIRNLLLQQRVPRRPPRSKMVKNSRVNHQTMLETSNPIALVRIVAIKISREPAKPILPKINSRARAVVSLEVVQSSRGILKAINRIVQLRISNHRPLQLVTRINQTSKVTTPSNQARRILQNKAIHEGSGRR